VQLEEEPKSPERVPEPFVEKTPSPAQPEDEKLQQSELLESVRSSTARQIEKCQELLLQTNERKKEILLSSARAQSLVEPA